MLLASRPALLIALALFVAAAATFAWMRGTRDTEGTGRSRTVLVTGFGPFGTYTVNPAWEAIRGLEGRRVADLEVKTARIEVAYATVGAEIQAALDRTRPDVVLGLGVAPGEHLRIETLARNRDTTPHPDNRGEVRHDVPIRAGGADLPTGLPVEALLAALHIDGYEVRPSSDAGGYLCNHFFYELMTRVPPGVAAGFVHVPEFAGPWDRERLERAVVRMLEVLAAETASR